MRHLLLFIILFATVESSAQRLRLKTNYAAGSVHFNDGKVLDCSIGFPILNKSGATVSLRSKNHINIKTIDDEKIQLDNREIDYIIFEGEQGTFLLRWTYRFDYRGKKRKLTDYKNWVLLEGGCQDVMAYAWAEEYDLSANGSVTSIYYGEYGHFGLYCLQKSDEKYPTSICSMTEGKGIGYKKQRKKALERYFENDAHAEAFLEGKKKLTVEEIMNYIENRCQN